MHKNLLRLMVGVLWLALTACSINLEEATLTPRPVAPTSTPTLGGETPPPPKTTWAALNLSGKLLFIQPKIGIMQLDLANGVVTPLWALPENGWLLAFAASPDGTHLLLAYGPPPPAGLPQLGYTDLYVWPTDGSRAPEPLVTRASTQETFFNPLWSPDGKYIYYTHFTASPPPATMPGPGTPPPSPFQYTIERLAYPSGTPESLVANAFWPTLSPNGERLAYATFDPTTQVNELFIANADGSDPTLVVPGTTFSAIDAPLFTPDGQALVFSAVGEGPASLPPALSWMEEWLGAAPVWAAPNAHNVPSDWWRVSLTGEALTRLTRIYAIGMYGDFAPDGRHLALISDTGVWALAAEGGEVVPLVSLPAFGTIEWVR